MTTRAIEWFRNENAHVNFLPTSLLDHFVMLLGDASHSEVEAHFVICLVLELHNIEEDYRMEHHCAQQHYITHGCDPVLKIE